MSTRRAESTVTVSPEVVLEALSRPCACRAWCPVPFELHGSHPGRLTVGAVMTVGGSLAGQALDFVVEVLASDVDRFAIRATGPFVIEATYDLALLGPELTRVSVEVRTGGPRGLRGRALAGAADGFLRAGLLESALRRLGRVAGASEPTLAGA